MNAPQRSGRWSARVRFLLVCALVVAVTVGAYWVYAPAANPAASNALTVEPARLNLGEVWETNHYAFNLPVTNRSGEVVHVANIVGSCSCLQIEPRTLDLVPGEVREIGVTVDLTREPVKDDGTDARPFEAELYPLLDNGRLAAVSWPLKATVRSPFRVTPAYIDFGEVMRGDKLPTATLHVHGPLEVKGLAAVPKDGSVVARVTASPTEFTVEVSPSDAQPGGVLNTSVVLSAEVPGQGKVTKEAPVVGRLLDDVCCVPDCLSFGAVPVGQTVEDMVLLRSRSGQKFEIVGIDADEASGLTAAPASSPPGSAQFRIAQKCSGVGLRTARLRFIVRREGRSESDTITLPVVQHAIPKS